MSIMTQRRRGLLGKKENETILERRKDNKKTLVRKERQNIKGFRKIADVDNATKTHR